MVGNCGHQAPMVVEAMPLGDVRLSLDVIMEDFWTRPTGVYAKPVWIRDDVLQLFYDDDNTELQAVSHSRVPGGHAAFTRTATVYSTTPLDGEAMSLQADARTTKLRSEVYAFVQRAGTCYFVEAGLLGFADPAAGESAGLDEQHILSSAIKWALSDYEYRHGALPSAVVLHCDVNGTLSLGDVASSKSFAEQAASLATDLLKRHEKGQAPLSESTAQALARAQTLDEEAFRQEYTTYHRDTDFLNTLRHIISVLNAEHRKAGRGAVAPALTVAIRTNGVEAENAALYVQKLLLEKLGCPLSEEAGTLARYVVTHEDKSRGLYFHPVLLEKLAKSASYGLEQYVEELSSLLGVTSPIDGWRRVTDKSLKKSDKKFKVYLGLAGTEDDKPAAFSSEPPMLEVRFARETWLTPGSNVELYKLQSMAPHMPAPWWVGFGTPRRVAWVQRALVVMRAAYKVGVRHAMQGATCLGCVGAEGSFRKTPTAQIQGATTTSVLPGVLVQHR